MLLSKPARGVFSVVAASALLLLCGNAQSQTPTPPEEAPQDQASKVADPEVQANAVGGSGPPLVEAPQLPVVIDRNGVSGENGSITFTHTMRLGTDQAGVTYSLIYNSGSAAAAFDSAGWRDSLAGEVGCFVDKIEPDVLGGSYVSVDGQMDVTESGLSERIASDEPLPSSRPSAPGGGSVQYWLYDRYVYTRGDGTVVTYAADGKYDNDDYGEQLCGRSDKIQKIVRPSGEIIDYYYTQNWRGPARLVISSNLGYQVRMSMTARRDSPNGCITMWTGSLPYQDANFVACLNTVHLIDTSVDNCPVDADCVYTRQWPTLSVNYPGGNVLQIVDATGAATSYTYSSQVASRGTRVLPTRVQTPDGRIRDIAYLTTGGISNPWLKGQVSSVTEGPATWTYAYNHTAGSWLESFSGDLTATDPTGRSMIYRTTTRYAPNAGTATPYLSSIVAPGGAVTTYNWLGYHNYRLKNVIQPSGLRTEYTYDARHNLTGVARYPAGGGAPLQVSMGYDAACANIFTCNQPNYRIDERGHRTDFTYDPTHGSLLTVVGPAAGSGPYPTVRPQITYEYETSSTGIVRLVRTRTCSTAQTCVGSVNETITETVYDHLSRPIRAATRAGNWAATTATTADSRSQVTGMTYSAFGDVASVDGPLPGAADTTWTYYNAVRQPVLVVSPDPDGAGPLPRQMSRTVYDAAGRPVREETGTGMTTDGSDFTLIRFKRSTYDPSSGLLIKVEEVIP